MGIEQTLKTMEDFAGFELYKNMNQRGFILDTFPVNSNGSQRLRILHVKGPHNITYIADIPAEIKDNAVDIKQVDTTNQNYDTLLKRLQSYLLHRGYKASLNK